MRWTWIKVHGFNDRSGGSKNIDTDRDEIIRDGAKVGVTIDVDTDSADYGFWRLMWVRFRKYEPIMRIVKAIEVAIQRGDTVVLEGYSNGWNYLLQALDLVCDDELILAPNQHIYLIGVHPAGKSKPTFPICIRRVMVYYTASDWAVRGATYASKLGIAPNWGRLGAIGYRGTDKRVRSTNLTSIAKGHGGAYREGVREWMAAKKVQFVNAAEARHEPD